MPVVWEQLLSYWFYGRNLLGDGQNTKEGDQFPLHTMLKDQECKVSSPNFISNIKQILLNKLTSIPPNFLMISGRIDSN